MKTPEEIFFVWLDWFGRIAEAALLSIFLSPFIIMAAPLYGAAWVYSKFQKDTE